MGIIAPVDLQGNLNISESSQASTTEKKTGSSMDKDDFLQLLVTQMKYQDPLEPESNTEYVAQLAQFSELEQMQNLNKTTTNTSAYSLVGQQVKIEEESSTGQAASFEGMVEYVTVQNGEAYVSVNGELHAYSDIVQVVDNSYYVSQYQPKVAKQSLTYMHHDPQNVQITGIDLGSNGYEAQNLAVGLVDEDGNSTTISNTNLKYHDGVLTIDKSAFAGLLAGEYNFVVVFDDANKTADYESVTLSVKGNPEITQDTTQETE